MSRADSTKTSSGRSISVNRLRFPRMNISIKRLYDPQEEGDGYRILVDRVWPRGFSKEKASWDEWLKEAAPSTELRRWFAHDPSKWEEFRRRYARELDSRPDVAERLLQRAWKEKVTLLYAARDTEHNEAEALKDYLLRKASA